MDEKKQTLEALTESITDIRLVADALEYTRRRLDSGELTTEQAVTLRKNYCAMLSRIIKEGGAA